MSKSSIAIFFLSILYRLAGEKRQLHSMRTSRPLFFLQYARHNQSLQLFYASVSAALCSWFSRSPSRYTLYVEHIGGTIYSFPPYGHDIATDAQLTLSLRGKLPEIHAFNSELHNPNARFLECRKYVLRTPIYVNFRSQTAAYSVGIE